MIRGKIIVDDGPDPYKTLRSAHGLSIYIEGGGYRVLWDLGPDPNILIYNLEKAGISISDIDMIFISHDHADHYEGIKGLADKVKGVPVYIPFGSSDHLKQLIKKLGFEVREVSSPTIISGNIMSIGQLYGPPYEHSLIVIDEYVLLFVGCSHPGITRIVDRAVIFGYRPDIIIGGFHLLNATEDNVRRILNDLIRKGVKKLSPIHCSGKIIVDLLKTKYKDYYMSLHLGSEFKF